MSGWFWRTLGGVLLFLAGAVGVSVWQFSSYAPKDTPMPEDKAALAWFIDDYPTARRDFLMRAEALSRQLQGTRSIEVEVPSGRSTTDLFVDGLYIPAQGIEKRRLLVVTSGVHGVEGPTGSAVQRLFMHEFLTPERLVGPLADTGVLLLHTVNPYGFVRHRRFTENNVDLNRNASVDDALYRTVNAGYPLVDSLINPQGPASTGSPGHRLFHLRSIAMIAQHGMPALRQAVLQGQYQVPQGIYFGGQRLEPQLQALGPMLASILDEYPLSMAIDLHTGYGERGTLHLFFDPPKDPKVRQGLETAFAGQRIDWGSGDDFYTVTGDFAGWLGQLRSGGTHLPAVFEYGTMDSQKTLGSIKSLHITVLENQGVQHGYASPADEERIKRDYREMFYPSSPHWRTKVIKDSRAMFEAVLANWPRVGAQP
ncbi:MAG TPA: M14 family metallopeptidase [Hydrogenophaga sp.]|uniref:M14 family metallopeptidase n=1 Tax=Hydrogenophaga sp. TaxID=1904254 RepID=UPI002BFF83AB|nr:M14 family metallopeptidase [Hydrogenophaga sp.]HMN92780.1 M14 family metallopeptidase [Hydrogenophaga sp.]